MLCIFFAAFVVIQYIYLCLLVYLYCRKLVPYTAWFLNNSLATVNQTQSTDPQLFGPESLGLSTKEKKKHFHNLKPRSPSKTQTIAHLCPSSSLIWERERERERTLTRKVSTRESSCMWESSGTLVSVIWIMPIKVAQQLPLTCYWMGPYLDGRVLIWTENLFNPSFPRVITNKINSSTNMPLLPWNQGSLDR